MRQWHVDPGVLCRQHLLGEHVEHHMLVGTIKTGRSLDGYLKRGLVIPETLWDRHDELAAEMVRRGYRHQSPLDRVPVPVSETEPVFNPVGAFNDLMRRCAICRVRASVLEED